MSDPRYPAGRNMKRVVVEGSVASTEFTEGTRAKDSVSTFHEDSAKEKYSLNYFESSLFASVLEDTIIQIRILGECNNEFRILKTLTDIVQLRARKYNIEQPAVKDELDGIDHKALGKEQYKLDKMANDRSRRELARQLRQQRNHIKSVNYDTDLAIDELKTQVEDVTLESEIRSRYISNWQLARTEQHLQTISDREVQPMINIELYKTRIDHEQRVHAEVEVFANIIINEKLEKVESWMNKFDKDMEKMDLRIQIMKNDHTNKLEYRMQLEDTFAIHEKLMKDWQHFKDEREKARQYVEKMTNAATVVQTWWRGLLVRLQLGPFKPAKRPPGKGKKK